jgi:hypothetical protein
MMPVNRMNNGHVDVTQGVSQMSSHSGRPVSEELLDTSRMTIEDLIEARSVLNISFFNILHNVFFGFCCDGLKIKFCNLIVCIFALH